MFVLNRLNDDILNTKLVKIPLNTSLTDNLFYVRELNSAILSQCLGLTRSALTCNSCSNTSYQYEPFSILSLSLTEQKHYEETQSQSVPAALELYLLKPDNITGPEKIRVHLAEQPANMTALDLKHIIVRQLKLKSAVKLFLCSRLAIMQVDDLKDVEILVQEANRQNIQLVAVLDCTEPESELHPLNTYFPVRFEVKPDSNTPRSSLNDVGHLLAARG